MLTKIRHPQDGLGSQRWRGLIGCVAVLAFLLGGVERVVGGGDQPVGIGPNLPCLLRDPDRHRDRDVRAGAALSIAAAHIEHPPRDDALSRKVDAGGGVAVSVVATL